MGIAEQPADERAEPVPVADKCGGGALEDFGFAEHFERMFLEPCEGRQSVCERFTRHRIALLLVSHLSTLAPHGKNKNSFEFSSARQRLTSPCSLVR